MLTKISGVKLLVICSLIAFTYGCGVAKPKQFDHASVQKDATAKVVSDITNEELILEFIASTGGAAASAQFGLIGALVGSAVDAGINNSRAKAAEERVEPFRVAASAMDLRQQMLSGLEAHKGGLPWTNPANITGESLARPTVDTTFLQSLDEQYFIHINTAYRLKPSLQVLELHTTYSVWDKSLVTSKKTASKAAVKPIYTNHVTYQSFPHNANKRLLTEDEHKSELAAYKLKFPIDDSVSAKIKARNKKKVDAFAKTLEAKTQLITSYSPEGTIWLENEGALLKSSIVTGADEVARLIVADLSGRLSLPESAFAKDNKTLKFLLATADDGRVIERAVHGGITSRHKDYPLYTAWD